MTFSCPAGAGKCVYINRTSVLATPSPTAVPQPMTTLAQFRDLARAEIGDTPGAPLWPDARLDDWTREAIREYGRALPRQAGADLLSIAQESAYVLPDEAVRV